MARICSLLLAAVFLSGCGSLGKRKSAEPEFRNPRSESAIGAPPEFALPGIPLRSDFGQQRQRGEETAAAATAPAAPAPARSALANKLEAPAKPAPEKSAPPAAVAGTRADYEFHLSEARRYSSKKKHLSAAAEYKAATAFIPPEDPMQVHLIERQGAMFLRAGDMSGARDKFQAAISKAGGLSLRNDDLANSHLGLGYCQEKAGRITEAIANYEKVLQLSTSSMIKGRVAETIEDLKKKK